MKDEIEGKIVLCELLDSPAKCEKRDCLDFEANRLIFNCTISKKECPYAKVKKLKIF